MKTKIDPECEVCQVKDEEISELRRQIVELQENVDALRNALENIHNDPDMQLAVLDSIRSMLVDRLRQKYLQAGAMSKNE